MYAELYIGVDTLPDACVGKLCSSYYWGSGNISIRTHISHFNPLNMSYKCDSCFVTIYSNDC